MLIRSLFSWMHILYKADKIRTNKYFNGCQQPLYLFTGRLLLLVFIIFVCVCLRSYYILFNLIRFLRSIWTKKFFPCCSPRIDFLKRLSSLRTIPLKKSTKMLILQYSYFDMQKCKIKDESGTGLRKYHANPHIHVRFASD